jgi:hypothetical protein
MCYRLSGYVKGRVLRIYLDNLDIRESQATFVYPNLLRSQPLVGILVGEDFDQQWFVSPSVLSRELLTPELLVELTKTIRLNRAASAGPAGVIHVP